MPNSLSPEQVPKQLHGLIVLNSVKGARSGASRSVMLAASPLQNLGIHLHFSAVRSILHFLPSFIRTGRYKYDFVIFNGLASLSRRSRFGHTLGRIVRALRVPTFIYWHETDWVLERHRQNDPIGVKGVDHIASYPSVVHLTASKACSQSIRRFYPNASPVEVYECADVPSPFNQPAGPTDPPTIVNLASIQERKGTDLFVETAIKVCQQHPTVEFIWLGHGKPYGTWQTDIEKANLQHRILFPGYVDSAYLVLRRASVFFLSSRDDPFPLSNLEAMCLGRTVMTFDIGGAPEALAGHGHIVPPFDTDAAANVILGCLAQSPETLINLDLRSRYLDLYTPEKFAIRLDRLLREYIRRDH